VALMATIFLSVYGREGVRELAEQNLAKAQYAATAFAKAGAKVRFGGAPRFNEFVLELPQGAEKTLASLLEKKIIGGLAIGKFYPELGANATLWCCTELTTRAEIDAAAAAIAEVR